MQQDGFINVVFLLHSLMVLSEIIFCMCVVHVCLSVLFFWFLFLAWFCVRSVMFFWLFFIFLFCNALFCSSGFCFLPLLRVLLYLCPIKKLLGINISVCVWFCVCAYVCVCSCVLWRTVINRRTCFTRIIPVGFI